MQYTGLFAIIATPKFFLIFRYSGIHFSEILVLSIFLNLLIFWYPSRIFKNFSVILVRDPLPYLRRKWYILPLFLIRYNHTYYKKDSCLPIKRRLIMQHFCATKQVSNILKTSKLANDHIFLYQNKRFSIKIYQSLSNERIE